MSIIELKELKFEKESELEAILIENPNVIEEGLSVMDTQVITNSGRLDILGLDSGKALVIIELKIEESDDMLWQTLDYYDWVFRNIDTVKRLYPNSEIDYSQTPRLMLIAPAFSEVIKRRAVYLETSVELQEYKYLVAGDEKGILLSPVSIPAAPWDKMPEKRPSLGELVRYITNQQSRELCQKVIQHIKNIGPSIQALTRKYHIAFYVKGSRFASISPRREFFWVGTYIGEDWKATKIETEEDFDNILEDVKTSFQKLGGSLQDEGKLDTEVQKVAHEVKPEDEIEES